MKPNKNRLLFLISIIKKKTCYRTYTCTFYGRTKALDLPVTDDSVRLSSMKGLLSCRSREKSTLSPYEHTLKTLKTNNVHCVRPNIGI